MAHWRLQQVVDALGTEGRKLRLRGLRASSPAWAAAEILRQTGRPLVILVNDTAAASVWRSELLFFLGHGWSPRVHVAPEESVLPWQGLSADRNDIRARIRLLHLLSENPDSVRCVVAPIRVMASRVIPRAVLKQHTGYVMLGAELDRQQFTSHLVEMGYHSAPLVEDPGTFCLRGGIIDLYPPTLGAGLRIELFGDNIDRIRTFDPKSQRTLDTLEEAWIPPMRDIVMDGALTGAAIERINARAAELDLSSRVVREVVTDLRQRRHAIGGEALFPAFYPDAPAFAEYLEPLKDALWWVCQPRLLERQLIRLQEECEHERASPAARGRIHFDPAGYFVPVQELMDRLAPRAAVEQADAESASSSAVTGEGTPFWPFQRMEEAECDVQPLTGLREKIVAQPEGEMLAPVIALAGQHRRTGAAVVIGCESRGRAMRLYDMLAHYRFQARRVEPQGDIQSPLDIPDTQMRSAPATIWSGGTAQGFYWPGERISFIGEEDIFGAAARRAEDQREIRKGFIPTLRELETGDLVVHVKHGVGRYGGLIKLAVQGVENDFLLLNYKGDDRLYVPVASLSLLRKFTGGGEGTGLDKLGGQTWEKRVSKVYDHLLEMAADLLRLYALRQTREGFHFSPPDTLFEAFEAEFEHEETPDQLKAIQDVIQDMASPKPMDRLICGDVGYGKTEVAMRAAFKAVLDRKQVAVLAPTTILAQQHFNSFLRRMKNFPVRLESLSRFRSDAEAREIVERLAEGKIDIVIGTHRLLANDVRFKDLGLLIIDEEHRFGVQHKEKIRKLRAEVDVLTLSATPIPRTMQMAFSGIRDLSLIATPPADRLPVRTFISKFDPAVVRDAIERELGRGGQLYFVHNRIQSIGAMKQWLNKLLPSLRIGVAHGQMNPAELERVMVEFVNREYDLLLCTTLIESGLDIPAVNTIIINRAEYLGLAQLYQLRGRVGRSKERGYAWLLVKNLSSLTREAEMRLDAIAEHQELGAGFHIASRDLEIRGAGNVVGKDQSGHVAAVGFDLYNELLARAIRQLRGEGQAAEVDPEVSIPVTALIPERYCPDIHERLGYYQRMSSAASLREIEDIWDELADRYGAPPNETRNLRDVSMIKVLLREMGVRELSVRGPRTVIALGEKGALRPEGLVRYVNDARNGASLTPKMDLGFPTPFPGEPEKMLSGLIDRLRGLAAHASSP
ncbi:MAG: Transcription-repair-coupling factor [Myxococcota bacterium]|nr:Transcription-repair-coupling factor [Myxococcota bacterium]